VAAAEIERLIQWLGRLPGFGPRSARRAALHMLKRKDALMLPLAQALTDIAGRIHSCTLCGNLDSQEPCAICADPKRDDGIVCVVEDVADLWALERSGAYRGHYHVLGGTLSALDGVKPGDLNIDKLVERAKGAKEIILATNATVEGQTTSHYLLDRLAGTPAKVTRLAQGVPIGGELHYLDDGTLGAALKARHAP
jgi:recombination protein RecR